MARFGHTLLAAAALLSAASANATVFVFTADAFNGVTGLGPQPVTSWNMVVPDGEVILSANFASTFGNLPNNPYSGEGNVTVGGIVVATCVAPEPCTGTNDFPTGFPTPISYDFVSSQFSSLVGDIDLVYTITGRGRPRLGASTLTITTGGPVPEPATWAMLIAGFGLVGAAARRRRQGAVAA
jgi:hypothetical protein